MYELEKMRTQKTKSQSSLNSFGTSTNTKVTQESVDIAILNFLLQESQPFTVVRRAVFHNPLSRKVMSYGTVIKKMEEAYSTMK